MPCYQINVACETLQRENYAQLPLDKYVVMSRTGRHHENVPTD